MSMTEAAFNIDHDIAYANAFSVKTSQTQEDGGENNMNTFDYNVLRKRFPQTTALRALTQTHHVAECIRTST